MKGQIVVPCCQCVGGDSKTIDLSTGVAPWRLISAPSGVPLGAVTPISPINPNWTAIIPGARWVSTSSTSGSQPLPPGHYIYQLSIRVPNCTVPMTVDLKGSVAGDDTVSASLIGASSPLLGLTPNTGGSYSPGGWGFKPERVFSISRTIGPGTYTLQMDVLNGGSSRHGLLVGASLTPHCSRNLEVTPSDPIGSPN